MGPLETAGFFRHASELGAEGIQAPVRGGDPSEIRNLVEQTGGCFEADLRLPQEQSEISLFEAEVRNAKEAGAAVARGVFLHGRRYEVFRSLEAFTQFHERAKSTLGWIEPILRRHRLKLAVENHKDHTAEELLTLMKAISSEWIGVLVDTGNNLALLEEPHEVVEALSPFALSVHLKDMAVQLRPDGFMLSEVPLGTGFLDLRRMVASLRKFNPGIGIYLEMATRDPLRVPCLTEAFFTTFPERQTTHRDVAMARLAATARQSPLPIISDKSKPEILAAEEHNNRHGLAWMDKRLRSSGSLS
jgi:sugar phosphate isomerase/epimerase